MKKILALFLVLCLGLAVLPAVAENEFSGTWYLVLLGLDGATFELNADGTFTGTSETGEDESKKTEGTWSADGDQVTFTVNSAQLFLSYNGTELILNAEDLAVMEMDSIGGMDMRMFDGMIKLSRDPGKITVPEFYAYFADGTVPEGKSKEDFDAVRMQLEPLFKALSENLGSGVQTVSGPAAGEEAAKPEVTILEENFYTFESHFGPEAVYIAKVQNNNEYPVYIDNGSLTLKDADGSEVGKHEWFGTCGSRYLSPGEISYVSFRTYIEEGVTAAGYDKEINASAATYGEDAVIELSNVELRSEEMFSSVNYYTAATFTNSGEEPLSSVEVLFIVKDSEGSMIDISERGLGMLELGAGSTITVVNDVNNTAVEYCEANGLTLGEVEAIAWK